MVACVRKLLTTLNAVVRPAEAPEAWVPGDKYPDRGGMARASLVGPKGRLGVGAKIGSQRAARCLGSVPINRKECHS